MLAVLCLLCGAVPNCDELGYWLFDCPMNNETFDPNEPKPYVITCPKSGVLKVECVPRVACTGSRTMAVTCAPTEGKSAGTALALSVCLGWLGADRFYLGYPTIGLFKLFTGGFFGLGWYADIFLIALQIVRPSRGGTYKLEGLSQLRVRLPGKGYY